jgi:hypothetical protein
MDNEKIYAIVHTKVATEVPDNNNYFGIDVVCLPKIEISVQELHFVDEKIYDGRNNEILLENIEYFISNGVREHNSYFYGTPIKHKYDLSIMTKRGYKNG